MAETEEVKHDHRPTNSKFKQQKLAAWKPVLTPKTVLPNVAIVGVIFIAVGIALLVGSNSVKEQAFDYTNCQGTNLSTTCAEALESDPSFTDFSRICQCDFTVDLTEDFGTDETFIYYALDEFYQNHRAYVKSRWDAQLRSVTAQGHEDCDPLQTINGKTVAPCGLVANSLFNDTILLYKCDDDSCATSTRVQATGQGISWKSDRRVKFQNPPHPSGDLCASPAFDEASFTKPPNWPAPACRLGQSIAESNATFLAQSSDFNSSGRGYQNEDLIVWMRTAALPDFRKLYRRIVDTDLSNGKYRVVINYNYPVVNFEGRKKIVISTVAWNGGQNPFLGITYLVVGSLCLGAVAVFAVLACMRDRELGKPDQPQWR